MAKPMNIEDIRKILSSEEHIEENPFKLLREISCYVNNPDTEKYGREFVLRALEKRDCFSGYWEILDSLTRQVGLYPYLEPEALSFKDLLAYELHRPPSLDETFVFHRAQAEIYYRLIDGENVIVSAPTSFGKSRIIDVIIATQKHKNIAIIVPTIALIDETRRRLTTYSNLYKIVTQLSQKPEENNIFVFTPERLNVYKELPQIDFFVIDEFYKIGAMSEDQTRTIALNQAFYNLHKGGGQFYLLGPNIKQIPEGLEIKFRCFFYSTDFATVVSELIPVSSQMDEFERLICLAEDIEDKTLIFCSSPKRVNKIARAFVEKNVGRNNTDLQDAVKWISENFHPDWIFQDALLNGIGMHHGKLPRSLSQYAVRLFNEGNLKFLVCTSTLIEGVNTKAKNVIIFDDVINRQKYDFFTFNNIKGRSGRMFHHFIGKVYIFHEPPQEELPFVDFPTYSQDDSVPESLLIQLDDDDLNESSRTRLSEIYTQEVLPLSIIKQNAGFDPTAQVNLAKYLNNLSGDEVELLCWAGMPSWEQLNYVTDLVWEYFQVRAKSGVFSADQLAFKINALSRKQNIRSRIDEELRPGQYAASSPDEAVERVLDFDRTWAGFEFPRLLMALSRIQEYILEGKYGVKGDYSFFAGQIETFFRNPVAMALEEYGLPIQITDKIASVVGLGDDLDEALMKVKQLRSDDIKLDRFELDLLNDVKKYL